MHGYTVFDHSFFTWMDVRVADAAVEHLDFDLIRARLFALELEALQAAVQVLCGVAQGFDHDGVSHLLGVFEHGQRLPAHAAQRASGCRSPHT